ncbi:C-type mannose receptor 2-like, partial [Silurus asotus]
LYFVALQGLATCDLVRKNFFVDKYLSWTDAQSYCRKYYEDLSTVNTPWDMLKFIKDVPDYLSLESWVGLSKKSSLFTYSQWSDGSDLGFPIWKFGEPNESYNCVTISDMQLADCSCKTNLTFFCYKWVPKLVLVNMLMTWEEALQYCRTQYTDLASMNTTKDIQSAVKISMTSQTQSVWTGLRYMDGSWFWVNQDPLGNMTIKLEFSGWKPGEPKMMNRYLCVYVFKSAFAVQECLISMPFFCYEWAPQIIVVQEMMNWDEALKHCRTHYTDLMSLNTETDLQAAKNVTMINQTPSVWTGLRFMDGMWFWVNKEPLVDLVLVPPCPIRPFQCGALKAGSYIMEGRNCNEKMTFIC